MKTKSLRVRFVKDTPNGALYEMEEYLNHFLVLPTTEPLTEERPLQEKVQLRRLELGLSQGDLSQKSGLSQSVISMIESGKTVPSYKSLEKLARALEVGVDFLV